jgi:hypothetical protein
MSYDQKVTVLLQSGLPIGIGSSGSVGANGALTLTTALSRTYPNVYLFFPVGAVYSSSPAGFYFCQMTSTTLGTIFNNLYANGAPVVPAVSNPVIGAGPGAYTQVTTVQSPIVFTVPGGTIGNNGSLDYLFTANQVNNGNNKTYALPWPGGSILSATVAAQATVVFYRYIINQNAQNSQVTGPTGLQSLGVAVAATQTFSADTSVGALTGLNLTLSAATDWIIIDSFRLVAYFS